MSSQKRTDAQESETTSSTSKEPIIELSAEGVVCKYPSLKKTESVRWDQVDQIKVETTDEGPDVCDVFIILIESQNKKGVVLPQDRAETEIVIDKILSFPNFDYRTWVIAMGSAENATFDVWKK